MRERCVSNVGEIKYNSMVFILLRGPRESNPWHPGWGLWLRWYSGWIWMKRNVHIISFFYSHRHWRTHTFSHTNIHIHKHTHIPTKTHAVTHALTDAHTCTLSHKKTQICLALIHTYTHKRARTPARTHARTNTHTNEHTHTNLLNKDLSQTWFLVPRHRGRVG